MWAILIGAFLVFCGILYLAVEALGRRRLSEAPDPSEKEDPTRTLEPRRQGLRFLGLARNWPGVALMVGGAALLLFGAV
ncbi:MAG TPA: hypothetical protein VD840_11045 [Sinorhizobium sp.]|nr:hypothetical protein [Sinorhizobium sp.]